MKRKILCALVIACLVSCVGSVIPARWDQAVAASAWVERRPAGDLNRNWLACASDATGQRLVAGDNGGQLWISADCGAIWSKAGAAAGGANRNWQACASDADGSTLIAAVNGGRLYRSTNSGTSWTEARPAGTADKQWKAVASDVDGSTLISAVYGERLWLSKNEGSIWSETRPAGDTSQTWQAVACDKEGLRIMALVRNGRAYVSGDAGVSWAEVSPAGNVNRPWKACAMDEDGSTIVLAAYPSAASALGRLYRSADAGATWVELQPDGNVDCNWQVVAVNADGSHIVAAVDGGSVWTSSNGGATWSDVQPAGVTAAAWQCCASSADGTRLMAGANLGRLYTGLATWSLSYACTAGGVITGATSQTVNYGASGTTVTATPNVGYHFVSWSDASTVNPRTDTNVTADIAVTATFAMDTFAIIASAGTNGSISPSIPQTIDYGSTQSFTINPSTGYHVQDVLVDGSTVGAVPSYTFTNVTANHTIAVSFAINTYTLTVNMSGSGSVAKSPDQSIYTDGTSVQLTATPATGYTFTGWSGDLTDTTTNPATVTMDANKVITASFAIDTYTLTYTAGANGTISGASSQTVNHGASGTAVTATPNGGYHFVSWSDEILTAARTDTAVTANVNATATFAVDTFTFTASAGANGAMDPSGSMSVNYGSTQSFTINPSTGYHVSSVLVDGAPAALTAAAYTFTNVTANHTIAASFAINTYTIVASADLGGNISPSGNVTVNHGASQSFTITPNTGYHVSSILVDGAPATLTAAAYTFTSVTAGHTIAATFAVDTFAITVISGSYGTVTPGTGLLPCHAAQAYVVKPDAGYMIDTLTVDGVVVNEATNRLGYTVTLTSIEGPHTIVATFMSIPDVTVPVNDVPSFTKGADQTVAEDCSAQSVAEWATNISAGPADEAGQVLHFDVINDNNALFSVQPAVSPTGILTYTPAANMNGLATVTLHIHDDGGTANGGVDTSASQTFILTVYEVNDPPILNDDSFTFNEDTTLTLSKADLLSNNVEGPANEVAPQTLDVTDVANSFHCSVGMVGNVITIIPDADYNGPASFEYTIRDDGTTHGVLDARYATGTVHLTVTPVNDVPSFTKGADQTVAEDCSAQSVAEWATNISAGPADEAGQVLHFDVINDNNALFSVQPAVSPTGILTYTPAANMNGLATVTLMLTDDATRGGAALTTAAQTFTITVTPVNDPPVNTAVPVISGIPHVGRTLPTTDGVWNDLIDTSVSGTSALSYAYQWQRSTDGGTIFADIPGAIGPTYILTLADNLQLVRVRVSCSNTGVGQPTSQSTTASSPPVTILNAAPVITEGSAAPTSCDEDENPVLFSLMLYAIDADEIDTLTWHVVTPPAHGNLVLPMPAVGSSTASSVYHPTANWNGTDSFTLWVEDGLTGSAIITVSITVNPCNDAPVNTVRPSIAGNLFVNHEVCAVIGSWYDSIDLAPGHLTYTYQWLRARDTTGTGLALIPGATASTYIVSPIDGGMYLAVRVTCTDDGEGLPISLSTSADSAFLPARYLDMMSPIIELPDFSSRLGLTGVSGGTTPSFTVTDASFALPFTIGDDRLDGVQWSISVGGRALSTPDSTGSFSHVLSLSEGPNDVQITAVDAAGNSSSRHLTITLDTHAPEVTLATTPPLTTANSILSIAGSIRDKFSSVRSLSVDGVPVIPYVDGTFRHEQVLKKGENTILIVSVDGAGNYGSQTYRITYTPVIPSPVSARQSMILTIGSKTMVVDGTEIALDAPAALVEDRTLVPLRALVEHLGGTISWNAKTRQVTVKARGTAIILTIGKSTALVNGKSMAIDPKNGRVVPFISSDRTMLPLRFVAENLGLQVGWNAKAKAVTLTWGD